MGKNRTLQNLLEKQGLQWPMWAVNICLGIDQIMKSVNIKNYFGILFKLGFRMVKNGVILTKTWLSLPSVFIYSVTCFSIIQLKVSTSLPGPTPHFLGYCSDADIWVTFCSVFSGSCFHHASGIVLLKALVTRCWFGMKFLLWSLCNLRPALHRCAQNACFLKTQWCTLIFGGTMHSLESKC